MGRRKRTQFEESLILNDATYLQYLDRLKELAISQFEWLGVPESIDVRYLELQLFHNGSAIYFNDDVMGEIALSMAANGNFDVYGEPVRRRAYSKYNNYMKELDIDNSVIIWNNYLRKNSVLDCKMFARRLYNLDRIIDVNVNAQKTPVLVQGTEKQRLTLLNLYKEYDGNVPFIFGDQNLNPQSLSVITTGAPYVADRLHELKTQIWNEALTYLGISNVSVEKKERLVKDEVERSHGGTIASRFSRLESRRTAADKISKMFNRDVKVEYREFSSQELELPKFRYIDSNLNIDK